MREPKGLLVGFVLATVLTGVAWGVINKFDIVDLTTGLRIGGAATSGKYLRGDGTNFVSGDLNVGDAAAGTLAVARGGTNLTGATDDNVMVGNGTTWESKALPSCSNGTTDKLLYNNTTNAFSCGTDQSGGGGTPGGANTQVQFNDSGSFGGDADYTWDKTNNRLRIQNGTVASDDSTNILQVSGSLPSSPSTTVRGVGIDVTSAGSAAQQQFGAQVQLLAGYTGSLTTAAIHARSLTVGTAATLNLSANEQSPDANYAAAFTMDSGVGNNTTGVTIGTRGLARRSTSYNIGTLGKADDDVAGSNIGVLGNASHSTEATDLKNIGVLGTLNTSLVAENISAAGYFDGGTLADASTHALRVRATMPASPAASPQAILYDITSAGTAAQSPIALRGNLASGYTGTSPTFAAFFQNNAAGTDTDLRLNTNSGSAGNVGVTFQGTATGAGLSAGGIGDARNSTARNVGLYGKATSTAAGSNIGVLGNGANSTEATDLKNIGGWFTLASSLPTSNISTALGADNGSGTDDIARFYDNGTVMFRVQDAGFLSLSGVAFASLGTPSNGTFTFCTDCTKATPCAGSGNGAWAVRINGAWDCNV